MKKSEIYFHESANFPVSEIDLCQLSNVRFTSRPQPPTYNPPIATKLPFLVASERPTSRRPPYCRDVPRTRSVRDRYKRDYPLYTSCDREISWPHCARERVAHTRTYDACVCVCVNIRGGYVGHGRRVRATKRGRDPLLIFSRRVRAVSLSLSLSLSLFPERGNVSEQGRPSDRDGRRQPLATRARRVLREENALLSHCLFGTSVARFGQADREAWPGNEGSRDAAEIAERGRARTSAERSSFEASGSVHAQRPAGVHSR